MPGIGRHCNGPGTSAALNGDVGLFKQFWPGVCNRAACASITRQASGGRRKSKSLSLQGHAWMQRCMATPWLWLCRRQRSQSYRSSGKRGPWISPSAGTSEFCYSELVGLFLKYPATDLQFRKAASGLESTEDPEGRLCFSGIAKKCFAAGRGHARSPRSLGHSSVRDIVRIDAGTFGCVFLLLFGATTLRIAAFGQLRSAPASVASCGFAPLTALVMSL